MQVSSANPPEATGWLGPQRGAMTVVILLMIAGFSFTHLVTRSYKAREEALAQEWFSAGERDLQSGSAQTAVAKFQTAIFYAHEDDRYRLRLAEALAAAGRTAQARAHLLNLWDKKPGDGVVNLQLARLAVRTGDLGEAMRYYHAAIYGGWESNPQENRLAARFELASTLLDHKQTQQAQSELIALAADLPPQRPDLQLKAARLFLRSGEPKRALDDFDAVLHRDRQNPVALAGAAEASFNLGNVDRADHLLAELQRTGKMDDPSRALYSLVKAVIDADPFAPGVTGLARAQRVIAAYNAASARLDRCISQTPSTSNADLLQLSSWSSELEPRMQARRLRGEADVIENAMRFVFQAEDVTARTCGESSDPADQALRTLARVRMGGGQ